MSGLLNVFSQSPFKKLTSHIGFIEECSQLLDSLFSAYFENRAEEVNAISKSISQKEHEADKIKNNIRNHLPKSLFLPVDRGDLLTYLHLQDNIADAMQDVSVLMSLKIYPLPKNIQDQVLDLVSHARATCAKFAETSREFSNLLEASFSGKEAEKVLNLIDEIGIKEYESDKIKYACVKELLAQEESMGAISVIMWMKITEELDNIANYSESTANLMRTMIAKS
jgi:uncharacterized protein